MAIQAPAISVRDLRVVYADRSSHFTGLSIEALDVAPGSLMAVTGPSGSGKSTLLYALAGLIRPTAGTVTWDGRNILDLPESGRDRWRRHTIGFVFQDFHLLPELTPLANVLLPGSFENVTAKAELRKRALALLDGFGVPQRRKSIADLSRGEQQRVALARALLFDPPVLLADEPTASLDAAAGELVAKTLEEFSIRDGRTVIAVTHDPVLVERIGLKFELERGHVRGDAVRETA